MKKVIFPLIKQQLPKAQIKIYGSYPDKKALNLHNEKEGFYVLGRAKDALDVTRKARVSLAPLRFGAGIKGKLIDAMLAGTPSVTTVIGAEGMKGKHEWPGVVASDDQDFADAAVKLFVDQDYWERKAACGDEILKHEFDASIVSAELAKVIAEGITNLRANRSVNFIGSMLRHHGSQSTKYMSKWIEEKNKAKN